MKEFNGVLESYPVETIINKLNSKENTIDINPSYQRGVVWSLEQKQSFIHSVCVGFITPNVVWNQDRLSGETICIDGKQRLTSLNDFYHNKFSVKIIDKSYYFGNNDKNKSAKIFSSIQKSDFLNCTIPVVKYTDLPYKHQIELFKKLQQGSHLTLGEKICSLFDSEDDAASFIDFCVAVSETINKFFTENEKKRYVHYEFALKLLYICSEKNISKMNKKTELEKFAKSKCILSNKQLKQNTKTKITNIFEIFNNSAVSSNIDKKILLIVFCELCKSKEKLNGKQIFDSLKYLNKQNLSRKSLDSITSMYKSYISGLTSKTDSEDSDLDSSDSPDSESSEESDSDDKLSKNTKYKLKEKFH